MRKYSPVSLRKYLPALCPGWQLYDNLHVMRTGECWGGTGTTKEPTNWNQGSGRLLKIQVVPHTPTIQELQKLLYVFNLFILA
jgi:hypothetical protein